MWIRYDSIFFGWNSTEQNRLITLISLFCLLFGF
jgi:hypothetical protein